LCTQLQGLELYTMKGLGCLSWTITINPNLGFHFWRVSTFLVWFLLPLTSYLHQSDGMPSPLHFLNVVYKCNFLCIIKPNFLLHLVSVTPYKWFYKEVTRIPPKLCCKNDFQFAFNNHHFMLQVNIKLIAIFL